MQKVTGYVAVFCSGFAACAGLLWVAESPKPKPGRNAVSIVDVTGEQSRPSALPSVAEAAARVEPAVVNIEVTGMEAVRRGPLSFLAPRSEEPFDGSGSGIIVSADGYIVTNNHVIAPVAERNSGTISVTLNTGKEYKNVSIVGRDPQTDLAVIKVHGAENLPVAEFGDSENLRVGDWAIAVGNPLGFNSSVTLGIISALNRSYERSDTTALDRVIQTDAAINPGNSGGALADTSGRIIGINTAIASQNGGSVGIGFAIPIHAARRIVEQLIQNGKVIRPYLGIVYSPLEGVERSVLPSHVRLPDDNRGVVLINRQGSGWPVVAGSPAAKAGLQEYDVLRAINGQTITNGKQVKDAVLAKNVGDSLTLKIWRNGTEFDLTLTLEAMP